MRLAPLIGISVVAWFLILLETYLFFGVIIPLGPPIHSVGVFTAVALLKLSLTFGLGVLWFAVIASITGLYARSKARARPPTSSS
ncbi:MAG: hypothetical protein LYZ70_00820 [Nitrososphaerales archaeon]|nr:hypothetical protein [Nitrososphaerales archaeon]